MALSTMGSYIKAFILACTFIFLFENYKVVIICADLLVHDHELTVSITKLISLKQQITGI